MCDFVDKCETGDEIGVRRSVESFLGGILDRVVELDEERKETRIKDSVEIFYNGLIDTVVNRLETEWNNYSVPVGLRGGDDLAAQPVWGNETHNLPTISKALRGITSLVIPDVIDVVAIDNKVITPGNVQVQNQKRKKSYLSRKLKALKFKETTDKGIDVKKERVPPVSITAALKGVLPVSSLIVPEVKGHLEQTTLDRETGLVKKMTENKTGKYKIKRWKKKNVEFLSNTNGDTKKGELTPSSEGLTFSEKTLESNIPAMLNTPTLQPSCEPSSNGGNDTNTTTEMIDNDKKPKFKVLTRVLNYIKGRVRKDEIPTVTMDTSEIMELGELELEFNFKQDIEEAEAEYQTSLKQKKKTFGQKVMSVLSRVGMKCSGCTKR